MKHEQGFTIVEAMIVVAVIGVLATIAFPLYNDYMDRSKVAEPMQLMLSLRQPVQEYYATWNTWPTISDIGGRGEGRYTASITSGGSAPEFYLEATLADFGSGSQLSHTQLRAIYNSNDQTWICTTQGAANPIPEKLTPAPCR